MVSIRKIYIHKSPHFDRFTKISQHESFPIYGMCYLTHQGVRGNSCVLVEAVDPKS